VSLPSALWRKSRLVSSNDEWELALACCWSCLGRRGWQTVRITTLHSLETANAIQETSRPYANESTLPVTQAMMKGSPVPVSSSYLVHQHADVKQPDAWQISSEEVLRFPVAPQLAAFLYQYMSSAI